MVDLGNEVGQTCTVEERKGSYEVMNCFQDVWARCSSCTVDAESTKVSDMDVE